jgi:hypothetical protein
MLVSDQESESHVLTVSSRRRPPHASSHLMPPPSPVQEKDEEATTGPPQEGWGRRKLPSVRPLVAHGSSGSSIAVVASTSKGRRGNRLQIWGGDNLNEQGEEGRRPLTVGVHGVLPDRTVEQVAAVLTEPERPLLAIDLWGRGWESDEEIWGSRRRDLGRRQGAGERGRNEPGRRCGRCDKQMQTPKLPYHVGNYFT